MLKDIIVGVALIFYVFSAIGCFTVIKQLIIDVSAAAIPEFEEEFREYANAKVKLNLLVLLFSLIPLWNTFWGVCVGWTYDGVRDSFIKELQADPEWDEIREKAEQLNELLRDE